MPRTAAARHADAPRRPERNRRQMYGYGGGRGRARSSRVCLQPDGQVHRRRILRSNLRYICIYVRTCICMYVDV